MDKTPSLPGVFLYLIKMCNYGIVHLLNKERNNNSRLKSQVFVLGISIGKIMEKEQCKRKKVRQLY